MLKNAHLLAFPSSFPVSSTGQAYCGVHRSTPLADSPTRRRGNSRSLFVATLLSGLREPCIWAFLSSLREDEGGDG